MKLCSECNVEMKEGKFFGTPFRMNMDNDIDSFFIDVYTGDTKKNFLGMEYPEAIRLPLKARICPKCGKVEAFVSPEDLNSKI